MTRTAFQAAVPETSGPQTSGPKRSSSSRACSAAHGLISHGDVRPLLPDFAYTATMPDGTRENEACPVFGAVAAGDPDPDPAEVAEWRWVGWPEFLAAARTSPWLISPWAALQARELDDRFGPEVCGPDVSGTAA